MEEKEQDGVLVFDTLFTTNELQMLKVLLPHIDPSMQKNLAIYIKFKELLYTFSYFRHHRLKPPENDTAKDGSMTYIFHALQPYCSKEQKNAFQQMEQMMQMMKNYKEVMQMMDMLKDIMPEGMDFPGMGSTGDDSNGFSPDMLLSLLSPKQQEMFEMLKGGLGNE